MESATQRLLDLEVVVEVPKGGFVKRGATDAVDFFSPFPCPFNYGAVHALRGRDNDYLDAVVLGKRRARGSRLRVAAVGAVGFVDRGIRDDKLICSRSPVGPAQRRRILLFFHFYAFCKRWLNRCRGHTGPTRCEGWGDAGEALRRSVPAAAADRP